MLKVVSLGSAISEAKELVENKLAKGMNADELLEIGDADGFKIYIAAGKTRQNLSPYPMHENPKGCFHANPTRRN